MTEAPSDWLALTIYVDKRIVLAQGVAAAVDAAIAAQRARLIHEVTLV